MIAPSTPNTETTMTTPNTETASVQHNDVVTSHTTTLDLAERLAACCTFYFVDTRNMMHDHGRVAGPLRECWLVRNTMTNTWRVTDPGARLADEDEVVSPYQIDGRSSEIEVARAILKMINSEVES